MFKLDYSSFSKISENSNQVMIYGWHSCNYEKVIECLDSDRNSPVLKVFTHRLGNLNHNEVTLEGRTFSKVFFKDDEDESRHIARKCKAALVNLIIENCKRHEVKLPLIPLIFCYDIEGKKRPVSPVLIYERGCSSEKFITPSELRRCYKLCKGFEDIPFLSKVSEVAKKTIKFVKLQKNQLGQYEFIPLAPFWEDPSWTQGWQQHLSTKTHLPRMDGWRKDLLNLVINSNKKRPTEEINQPNKKPRRTN